MLKESRLKEKKYYLTNPVKNTAKGIIDIKEIAKERPQIVLKESAIVGIPPTTPAE
jgi:hypothetical protein